MKKIIILLVIAILASVCFTGCEEYFVESVEDTLEEMVQEMEGYVPYPGECPPEGKKATLDKNGIAFQEFVFISAEGIGDMYFMRVPSNQEIFYFYNNINTRSTTKWYVCKDIGGLEVIPSKTVSLVPGDNIYYIMTEKENGDVALYTVNIHQNLNCCVGFEGSVSFHVEEGTIIDLEKENIPDGEKEGYIFKGWDFDFSNRIMNDTEIKGIWEEITEEVPNIPDNIA